MMIFISPIKDTTILDSKIIIYEINSDNSNYEIKI